MFRWPRPLKPSPRLLLSLPLHLRRKLPRRPLNLMPQRLSPRPNQHPRRLLHQFLNLRPRWPLGQRPKYQ